MRADRQRLVRTRSEDQGLHRDLIDHAEPDVAIVPVPDAPDTTFLAALRHDRITAPCVFDGAINGERFLAYVEQALAPTLRRATS